MNKVIDMVLEDYVSAKAEFQKLISSTMKDVLSKEKNIALKGYYPDGVISLELTNQGLKELNNAIRGNSVEIHAYDESDLQCLVAGAIKLALDDYMIFDIDVSGSLITDDRYEYSNVQFSIKADL